MRAKAWTHTIVIADNSYDVMWVKNLVLIWKYSESFIHVDILHRWYSFLQTNEFQGGGTDKIKVHHYTLQVFIITNSSKVSPYMLGSKFL